MFGMKNPLAKPTAQEEARQKLDQLEREYLAWNIQAMTAQASANAAKQQIEWLKEYLNGTT